MGQKSTASFNSRLLLALALALFLRTFRAADATVLHGGGPGDSVEPTADNTSIVRDYTGKIVAASSNAYGQNLDYAEQLSTPPIWSSIDNVMNQCYSGGFESEASTLGNGLQYTIATSCRFDQLSWSGNPTFTGAWAFNNDLAPFGNPVSMSSNFLAALNGKLITKPPVPKDQAAVTNAPPPGQRPNQTYFEYPQYASPDPSDPDPNDSRSIPQGGAGWYAILVAWSSAGGNAQSAINTNLLNMYYTLTRVYGISPLNIGVLDANGMGNGEVNGVQQLTGNINIPGTGSVAVTMPINGTNVSGNYLSYLYGMNAAAGFTAFSNIPTRQSKAHLLIYNTGHGGSVIKNGMPPALGAPPTWVSVPQAWASNWVQANGNAFADPEMGSEINADGGINVQITSDAPLVSTDGNPLSINVDGYDGTLTQESSSQPLDDLSAILGGSLYYYLVDVPTDSPNFDGFDPNGEPGAVVTLPNLQNPDDVQAFTFDGGLSDQTLLVPEPAPTLIISAGVLMVLVIRPRRQSPFRLPRCS
jgi:hypothetical protein